MKKLKIAKKQKAVIYARVSSAEQEKNGFSIPAQLDLLEKYAKDEGFDVVEKFIEAETAKNSGRTEFNKMIKFLKHNKDVKTILAEKTDRLYRNFYDYIALDVDETGYDICLVKEHVVLTSESNSHAKFVHAFKVLMSKNFIDNLKEETKKGIQEKVEKGYFAARVPYGYKKLDKDNTIINEEKAPFVRRAFELYAKGDISLKNLSKKLKEEGFIYTNSTRTISTGYLEKMLKNKAYIGFIWHNDKYYKGKHPNLVSEELFYKAQAAFKKDGKPKTSKTHTFLYAGLMKCAECGRMITSEIKKNRLIYYRCTGNYGKCVNKSVYIREEKLDAQFDEAIKNITIDEDLADYLNELLAENYKEAQIYTKEEQQRINKLLASLETRKDKILDMYMDEKIDTATWNSKNQKIEAEICELKEKLEKFKRDNKGFINEGKKIIELAKNAYSLYCAQPLEEKRKILKCLFYNASLKGEKLCYTYNSPFNFFAKIDKNKKIYPREDSNLRHSP